MHVDVDGGHMGNGGGGGGTISASYAALLRWGGGGGTGPKFCIIYIILESVTINVSVSS